MGKQRIDLTNQRFGKLKVDSYSHTDDQHRAYWNCTCDCGNITVKATKYIRCKDTNSCGKCRSCIYKLSKDGSYYEGYIINKLSKVNKEFNEFDMSIFNTDEIIIEDINIEIDNIEQLAYSSNPDFIFDKICYDHIIKYNWMRGKRTDSIETKIANKKITLQRHIVSIFNKHIELTDDVVISFKDNRGFDYRVDNLIATGRSLVNQRKSSNSKYRGVYSHRGKYESKLQHNGVSVHIGTFDTPEEAAMAYNVKAKELFGDLAYQNVIKK